MNKITGHEVDRRLLLKGAAAGGLGIAGATMLAGCAADATGPVNFGVRTVDESPKAQAQAIIDAYVAKTGIEVTGNFTESNAFQNNLSQYLQGTPDDAFQWMAGYRMQFFADQGLLEDLTSLGQHRRPVLRLIQDCFNRIRRQAVLLATELVPMGPSLP